MSEIKFDLTLKKNQIFCFFYALFHNNLTSTYSLTLTSGKLTFFLAISRQLGLV